MADNMHALARILFFFKLDKKVADSKKIIDGVD